MDEGIGLDISSVDGQQAMAQFGERAAVVSGRLRGGQVARAAQGPGLATAYTFEEIGTLVRVTPHLKDGGEVVVELQIEKSDISPLTPQIPPDDEGAMEAVPPNIARLATQSTLRLFDGRTHAACRKATSSPQGMVETVLFLTASADDADLARAPRAADSTSNRTSDQFRQFRLKATDPSGALRVLQQIFVDSPVIRMELDPDANAIIAYAKPEELEAVAKVLEHLEVASSRRGNCEQGFRDDLSYRR
jgi:type II secretory pathway component GspD/PulD (secretin)